jgi:splicing factor 3B subunit 3
LPRHRWLDNKSPSQIYGPFAGDTRDYIIVGSDSGRIVILQYNNERNTFDKIHQETFGKSGCRRIVPGQYLAVDPKGRAVMIGTNRR